jgi:hypothetical protein
MFSLVDQFSLVDHVRSVLSDPTPPWESVPPEAKTIIRLCLGCRSESRILDKLQVLGTLNQCISAPALRGQWNNAVDDYIHKNIQHPTGWIKLMTGKGTKLTDNEAISELVAFYCDTWSKFQRWEKNQLSSPAPKPTSIPEAVEQETVPEPVLVAAAPQETQPSVQASLGTSIVQAKKTPLDPSANLPFQSLPTPYKTVVYFIQGDPKLGQGDGVFWYVVIRENQKTQSDQSFSSPIDANFAARAAIDILMGSSPTLEAAPATALKRGSKRGQA